MPPVCSAHSDLRRVQDCRDTVLGGDYTRWLSQTPRLSSVQHQTARGEMTDDGENAELRTAEAGGGAGRGGGRWPPRISRSPAPRCAACTSVPLVLVQTWQMLRVRKPLQDTEPGPGRERELSCCLCLF